MSIENKCEKYILINNIIHLPGSQCLLDDQIQNINDVFIDYMIDLNIDPSENFISHVDQETLELETISINFTKDILTTAIHSILNVYYKNSGYTKFEITEEHNLPDLPIDMENIDIKKLKIMHIIKFKL
jgi:hypothetical protein